MSTRKEGNNYVDPDKFFVVHRDQQEWLKHYRGKETPIDGLFAQRQKKLENGEPFWDPDHDEEMQETARERNKTIGRGLLGWLRGGGGK